MLNYIKQEKVIMLAMTFALMILICITPAYAADAQNGKNNNGTQTVEKNSTQTKTTNNKKAETAPSAIPSPRKPKTLHGEKSDNIHANNYSTFSETVKTYLYENSDSTLTRVEYSDKMVIIEDYDKDGKLLKSHNLSAELNIFGGFFCGKEHNYLVFGNPNENESDTAEVMRVVKYSKNWKRENYVSVYGANTTVPFYFGSLRMSETAGRLYIHTCHEMYTSRDGLNHQANMAFVIDENKMNVVDSYCDIMNIDRAGYVSHSFNQFIAVDGGYVYRVDHGDAAPRAISVTRFSVSGSINDVIYDLPLMIDGEIGDNSTGVSIGGFEISSNECLIAGNAVPLSSAPKINSHQRNIFVITTDKNLNQSRFRWITNYDNKTNVKTPQLVKLNDEEFLLMWEEYSDLTDEYRTKFVALDEFGDPSSDIYSTTLPLSDCKPIYCKDGLVKWICSNDTEPILCAIDPYNPNTLYNGLVSIYRTTEPLPFDDVKKSDWFNEGVTYAYWNSLMNGSYESSFEPKVPMTRGMLVAVLGRAEGVSGGSSSVFSDVNPKEYYAPYITWASRNGIVNGVGSGMFAPDDIVTREEIAKIFKGYYEYLGEAAKVSNAIDYADANLISDWAVPGVAFCKEKGLMQGKDGNMFDPQSGVTRAEAATILMRANIR